MIIIWSFKITLVCFHSTCALEAGTRLVEACAQGVPKLNHDAPGLFLSEVLHSQVVSRATHSCGSHTFREQLTWDTDPSLCGLTGCTLVLMAQFCWDKQPPPLPRRPLTLHGASKSPEFMCLSCRPCLHNPTPLRTCLSGCLPDRKRHWIFLLQLGTVRGSAVHAITPPVSSLLVLI